MDFRPSALRSEQTCSVGSSQGQQTPSRTLTRSRCPRVTLEKSVYHPISQPGTTRLWNPQPPRRAPLAVQSPRDAGARTSFYISRGPAYGREKALRGAGPLQPHEAPSVTGPAPQTPTSGSKAQRADTRPGHAGWKCTTSSVLGRAPQDGLRAGVKSVHASTVLSPHTERRKSEASLTFLVS